MAFQARNRADSLAVGDLSSDFRNESNLAAGSEEAAEESELLRDTLVFHLGTLLQSLLTKAFREPERLRRYRDWLAVTRETQAREPRIEVSRIDCAAGQVLIDARPVADEFLLAVAHTEFSVVLSAAFSVNSGQLLGVHLVHFEGKAFCAARWIHALVVQASQRHAESLN